MFCCKVNAQVELRMLERHHAEELFRVVDANRKHLRAWLPWLDVVRSAADTERYITAWLQQFATNRGFHAGVWHDEGLCGVINHVTVDWSNRTACLAYWLARSHEGKGIITSSCREFLAHAFDTWQLNRITIESATGNVRSRAIAERLGFKLEGVVRQAEWLYDHYVDHAFYGLLKSEWEQAKKTNSPN